ncbi:Scramblase-domain-containing protein [Auriculariales sp. MPI-PUGE-AT-0066]|nr:Scramblase-domain-containing protein [Auriculariales sp. MPI-PUGE-AT-0066]
MLRPPLLAKAISRPLAAAAPHARTVSLILARGIYTRQGGSASRIGTRPTPTQSIKHRRDPSLVQQDIQDSVPEDPPVWSGEVLPPTRDAKRSLARLLSHNQLIITRQIEMLNIFLGFEQSNKYAINTADGQVVGYILEEPRGILSTLSRQLFRTHRPFRALVLDPDGAPILWLRRPFAWINSRLFVQHQALDAEPDTLRQQGEETLESFGVVQQRFHLWRRRYELYLKNSSLATHAQAGDSYQQFGQVDAGFLAWTFPVVDETTQEMACVDRNWRGLGREFFTDAGQYALSFEPRPDQDGRVVPLRELDIQERALILALSVTCDFDYFSRHSEGGGGGGWLLPLLVIFGE